MNKIGADAWLTGPNPYNQESGKKKHDKYEKQRPKDIKKHKKQRAEEGFSWFDWINFDSFIAGVVAEAVLQFAERSHGYFPIGGEEMDQETYDYPEGTYENYQATCGAIYFALTNWLNWDLVAAIKGAPSPGDAYAMEQVVYGEAVEAMILFSENLGRWWD